jgi:hypothetical protein
MRAEGFRGLPLQNADCAGVLDRLLLFFINSHSQGNPLPLCHGKGVVCLSATERRCLSVCHGRGAVRTSATERTLSLYLPWKGRRPLCSTVPTVYLQRQQHSQQHWQSKRKRQQHLQQQQHFQRRRRSKPRRHLQRPRQRRQRQLVKKGKDTVTCVRVTWRAWLHAGTRRRLADAPMDRRTDGETDRCTVL